MAEQSEILTETLTGTLTETRADIFGSALTSLEDGIAILDAESRVLLWNPAATAISGHLGANLLSRKLPAGFYLIDSRHRNTQEPGRGDGSVPDYTAEVSYGSVSALAERPLLVLLLHEKGHTLPAMLRRIPLRDTLGKRFGTMLRFHPVDEVDSIPHGAIDEEGTLEKQVERSQAETEGRLEEAIHEWTCNAIPFGILWISVDQAPNLRKTHGRDAAEAMLAIVERTLVHALRPTEMLGRWGSSEFLVLSHERTAAMLEAHAQHVCDLARTADFRWWGDRVPLTISVGVAQAEEREKLLTLLLRAQQTMQRSELAGGDQVSASSRIIAIGGQECSQS